ncbi:MAG TPA: SDR family oxidoreductase [Candidatus Limnocylindrales bacterium]|nr:SDR family oxidoreductase [Candidatus Limnocylindrales bacterium]
MNNRPKLIVTGASSGIGRATAVRFAGDGFDVCLNARREPRLKELAASLAPGDHLVSAGDYSDPEVIARIEKEIRARWGRVDVLVNCAGVFQGANAIGSPIDEWRRPFDTMFEGGVRITRVAVPLMPSGGRVIHITSIHGECAEANASAYAMAKAALNQFCRVLAVELASRGILVNAIAPGFVDTEMSIRPDGVNELETEWFRKNYVEGHHLPLKRAGRPEEIAGVAAFLAGRDSTYITGQVITVDGGLTITF